MSEMDEKLREMIRKVAKKDLGKWKEEWEGIVDVHTQTRKLTTQQGQEVEVEFIANKLGTIVKIGGMEVGRGRIIYTQNGKTATMEDGFVEEQYRRMGIGSIMLEMGKKEAELNGATEIIVEANHNSYGIASKMNGLKVKRV
jgi:ribosomal protein S18 acetylase RimI-like enzyme